MSDEGPITFTVQEDLDALRCTVRGGWPGDVVALLFQMLAGAALPVLYWLGGFLLYMLGSDAVGVLVSLSIVSYGFPVALGVLGTYVWFQGCPDYFGRAFWWALSLAFGLGVLSVAVDPTGVLPWVVAPAVLLGEAVLATVQRGVQMLTPCRIALDAHNLTVGSQRIPVASVDPFVEGTDLYVGDLRIPMGAHAPWEREWLVERIRRVAEAARKGTEREGERDALARMVGSVASRES